ncbi:MAG UNVERIFIED_CONTAM: hypothetical protein LVR18_45645 [Planctomycetaceae bacterium]
MSITARNAICEFARRPLTIGAGAGQTKEKWGTSFPEQFCGVQDGLFERHRLTGDFCDVCRQGLRQPAKPPLCKWTGW